MEALIPIIAILSVFGMPAVIVFTVMYFRFRTKQLEAGDKSGAELLLKLSEERKLLDERVQNLESIVCSVDFELNQRLNKLATGLSRMSPQPLGLAAPRESAVVPAASSTGAHAPSAAQPASAESSAAATRRVVAVHELVAGQRVLERYVIERELGRGGMGAVFLASDAKLGERVALKVISSAASDDPQLMAERFRREVAQARKITHPNVIRIHDIGEDGSLLFLSMEYIVGETLAERLRRTGPLPLDEATLVLGEIALGVAAAHAVGVIHRDLKPHNVLIANPSNQGGPQVKVIDFGLATSSFLGGMTATGMILGTPEYMAPEQLRGGTVDPRTDVYALGAIAYHVVCGRPPFSGESPIAIGFAHLHSEPRPPIELRPEVSASLQAAILRALAKDPAQRYADAAAWRDALRG